MIFRRQKLLLCGLILLIPAAAFAMLQSGISEVVTADPVSRLQERMQTGAVKLEFDPKWGYLPALLKNLDVPLSSQVLVFSKTSLQLDRIGPWAPRALYFNDDVYIGAVLGSPLLELCAADPKAAGVFFTLVQKDVPEPEFDRQSTTCLLCHNSSSTRGVPGFMVRSVYPDRHGSAIASVGSDIATDQTPVTERWGGWYMTGSHSEPQTLANWKSPMLTYEIPSVKTYLAKLNLAPDSESADLGKFFDIDAYLSPHSDAAALMVLTHQVNLHNIIAVANIESRKIRGSGDAGDSIRGAVEPLVRAMLFVREAPLSGLLKGSSNFSKEFADRGPRDSKGRSLRDFDLQRRLFRYPLSYLIYSDSFAALSDAAKRQIYQRFREILSGQDQGPDFQHLSVDDRRAILEVLTATKPDFAAFMSGN